VGPPSGRVFPLSDLSSSVLPSTGQSLSIFIHFAALPLRPFPSTASATDSDRRRPPLRLHFTNAAHRSPLNRFPTGEAPSQHHPSLVRSRCEERSQCTTWTAAQVLPHHHRRLSILLCPPSSALPQPPQISGWLKGDACTRVAPCAASNFWPVQGAGRRCGGGGRARGRRCGVRGRHKLAIYGSLN
jgi:hypothetical protein